jgi:hypothetical protein
LILSLTGRGEEQKRDNRWWDAGVLRDACDLTPNPFP